MIVWNDAIITNSRSLLKHPVFQQSQSLRTQPLPLVGRFGGVEQLENIGQHRTVVAVISVPQQAGIDRRNVYRIHARHHDQLAPAVAGAGVAVHFFRHYQGFVVR